MQNETTKSPFADLCAAADTVSSHVLGTLEMDDLLAGELEDLSERELADLHSALSKLTRASGRFEELERIVLAHATRRDQRAAS